MAASVGHRNGSIGKFFLIRGKYLESARIPIGRGYGDGVVITNYEISGPIIEREIDMVADIWRPDYSVIKPFFIRRKDFKYPAIPDCFNTFDNIITDDGPRSRGNASTSTIASASFYRRTGCSSLRNRYAG